MQEGWSSRGMEEMAQWGHSWSVLLAKYYSGCGRGIFWFIVGYEPLENPRYWWDDNIKWIFKKCARVWTGRIFLWMEIYVRLLWKPQWITGLHEMREIAWLIEVLLVCQKGFCFVQLVIILSKLTDGFTCLTCIGGD